MCVQGVFVRKCTTKGSREENYEVDREANGRGAFTYHGSACNRIGHGLHRQNILHWSSLSDSCLTDVSEVLIVAFNPLDLIQGARLL